MPRKKTEVKKMQPEEAEEAIRDFCGKIPALATPLRALLGGLWISSAEDITRKLSECIEEGESKFKVPISVVLDLEKDRVEMVLAWRGPRKKKGSRFTLSTVEPLLPGIAESLSEVWVSMGEE